MAGSEVALLLTDVEGSTGVLVRRGHDGVKALARVAALVTAAAHEHGGVVSTAQGEGDSALVVFESAARAVAASLMLNELMAKERWPKGERVTVRCAVHVGEVTPTTDDGVLGLEVHRCARLRGLADGGEVLLSSSAAILVRGTLPEESSLRDEGLIALRGFPRPERVWRLIDPRLRERHDPLRTATVAPAALPVWRTSFVGRSPDVARVASVVATGRLVTLVGPGGVGKTRLAAAVASQSPLRPCFIDLTRSASDDQVLALAAQALGAPPESPPPAGIEAILGAVPAFVVIDNCEHVPNAASSLLDMLLERCPSSQFLATSRAPLRVVGEKVLNVPVLPIARDGPAVELFLARAQAVRPDLPINDRALGDVVSIVELLDGVPLAIELAAARVNAFTINELLAVLRRDLAGLGEIGTTRPSRHRTVRSIVEWSVRTLDDVAGAALLRLALLPGTFRLEAATAVTGDAAAFAALPSLVERSLVVSEQGDGPTRYRVFEMVRSVALEALVDGERLKALDRLLVLCLAELAGHEEGDPPSKGRQAERAADRALYTTAVEHALATNQIDLGLRLVHDLFMVWHGVGERSTLDGWMSLLLTRAEVPSRIRGDVRRRQAIIAYEQLADRARATRLLDGAEADATAIVDRALLGRVRATRASFDLHLGRLEGVEAQLLEAVDLLTGSADRYVANPLTTLADLYALRGEFHRAESTLTQAAASDPVWFQRVHIEISRAWVALERGDVNSATSRAADAVGLAEQSGDIDAIADSVEVAAFAALARGDVAVARQLFGRTLTVAREHELTSLPIALAGLAIVAALDGDLATARTCRDEVEERGDQDRFTDLNRRLACAFVDLVDGRAHAAAEAATRITEDAECSGQPYAHVLGLELLAACLADGDPRRARRLLVTATRERHVIGAAPWPLDPYRTYAVELLHDPPRLAETAPA